MEGDEEEYYDDDDSYEFDPAAMNFLSAEPTGYSSSKRALSTISERTEESKSTSWLSRRRQPVDVNGLRPIPSTPTMTSYGQMQANQTLGAELGRMSPASIFTHGSARTGMSSLRTGASSYGQMIGGFASSI